MEEKERFSPGVLHKVVRISLVMGKNIPQIMATKS